MKLTIKEGITQNPTVFCMLNCAVDDIYEGKIDNTLKTYLIDHMKKLNEINPELVSYYAKYACKKLAKNFREFCRDKYRANKSGIRPESVGALLYKVVTAHHDRGHSYKSYSSSNKNYICGGLSTDVINCFYMDEDSLSPYLN